MESDVIFEKKHVSVAMPPYNWRELGFIKNVVEENQKDFYKQDIYQILPIKYLIKILTKGLIRFMNVAKYWQDPYELFLLKHDISVEGHSFKEKMNQMSTRYYGQCWSVIRDSDAMWRIYSHDNDSVRIKTTVGKMIDVLNQTRGMVATIPYFGKVQYLTKEEITRWLKANLNEGSGQLYSAFSDSLFIKRKEFTHENEMRFVLFYDETTASHFNSDEYKCNNVHDNFIDLEINPYKFIDEIAFDPRLNSEEFSDWKNMLSTISMNIPIVQSDLYDFQSISIALKKSPMHNTLL